MILNTIINITETYKGSSKYEFWKNLNVGSRCVISMELKPTGANRGKIYAPYISITNLDTGNSFTDTINSFQKYLHKIQFTEENRA